MKKIKLTERDLQRIVKRVLNESMLNEETNDNPDTESKNPALGGALGMFKSMGDAGKMTVEKRKKDMISAIKRSENVLMQLFDLHEKHQKNDSIRNSFIRFKDDVSDMFKDFYQNPDISEFVYENPFSTINTRKLIREITKLYEKGQQSINIPKRFYRIANDYLEDVKEGIQDIHKGEKMEEIGLHYPKLSDELMSFIEDNPIMSYKN